MSTSTVYRWRRRDISDGVRAERGALHAFHPTDPAPGSGPVRLSACGRVWTSSKGIRSESTADYFWRYQLCKRCADATGIDLAHQPNT